MALIRIQPTTSIKHERKRDEHNNVMVEIQAKPDITRPYFHRVCFICKFSYTGRRRGGREFFALPRAKRVTLKSIRERDNTNDHFASGRCVRNPVLCGPPFRVCAPTIRSQQSRFHGVRPRKLVQQPIKMCNGQINATITHFEGTKGGLCTLVNVYQDELSTLLSGPLTAPFQPL